jgi:hypothetical protein
MGSGEAIFIKNQDDENDLTIESRVSASQYEGNNGQ